MTAGRRLALVVVAWLVLAGCRSGSRPGAGSTSPTASPGALGSTPPGPCPAQTPLDPGPDPPAAASAAASAAVSRLYPSPAYDTSGFRITAVYPASVTGTGYAPIPFGLCGPAIGAATWVVELSFPRMVAKGIDLSRGQLFLARFAGGWAVWFQYH